MLLAVLMTTAFSLQTMAQVGTWQSYMAYYEPQQIVKAQQTLFVRATNSLYQYNLNDQSITTFDKINGLNDVFVTQIAWNQQVKKLIIVYDNGNIDLMDIDGNVSNMSQLYNKSMTLDKTVNNIFIDGVYAYLATGFGVVKVNMQRQEIAESYILEVNATDVTIAGGRIYIMTADGLYRSADVTANLIDPNNWSLTTDVPQDAFKSRTEDWDQYIELVQTLKPGGPQFNTFGVLQYDKGTLYSCGGDISSSKPSNIQLFDDNGEWTFFSTDNIQEVTGQTTYYKLLCIARDPEDSNHIFAGTRIGLVEFRDGQPVKLYNNTNSPIETALHSSGNYSEAAQLRYQIISGLKFDEQGNLWMLNQQCEHRSIIVLTKDGEWVTYDQPDLMKYGKNQSLGNMRHIIFDHKGCLWFVNNHSDYPGFFRFNPETQQLKCFYNFINQDGTTYDINIGVRDIIEDADHNIWVASNKGLFMLDPEQAEADDYYLTQIKVPRNDGTNYADYLLSDVDITSITIDGGGRKWVGTNGSGVYVISQDNMVQEEHFTVENSPILSDNIMSIEFNHKTGKVFIGTEYGLCSYMSDATEPQAEMVKDNVWAYPNPVVAGYDGLITVVGLSYNADVKILSASGKLIAQGKSKGGSFTWNGRDTQGKPVASGIYMVATATEEGNKGVVCKIAIVK